MPEVWVPINVQALTAGTQKVNVSGSTVREIIDRLEGTYPGVKALLSSDGEIMPGIAVIIDGEVTNMGMLARVSEDSEMHFLPAIGGGNGMPVMISDRSVLPK